MASRARLTRASPAGSNPSMVHFSFSYFLTASLATSGRQVAAHPSVQSRVCAPGTAQMNPRGNTALACAVSRRCSPEWLSPSFPAIFSIICSLNSWLPKHQPRRTAFNHQVEVIDHQSVGMHLPACLLTRLGQSFEKILPVNVVQYVLAPIATAQTMLWFDPFFASVTEAPFGRNAANGLPHRDP